MSDFYSKYIKYKSKYLELQNNTLIGGKKMKKKYNKYNEIINYNKMKKMGGTEPTYPKQHLSEPWFTLISLGLKNIEGRLNKKKFKEMKVGDTIEWVNDDFMPRSVITQVVGKNVYPTFQEYLESEGLENCLPGFTDIEDGTKVYYKYFTPEDESTYGVVAIKLELLNRY